jgi:transcriptional regulator with XRE-family HTH domain
MPATPATFAELVDSAAQAKDLNDYQLSAAIGLMPGNKVCSPKQVSRIRNGEQVNYSRDLVQRLIEVLDLDPAEAWELADKWPPGLTAEHLRDLGLFSSSRRERRADRQLESVPASAGVVAQQRRSTTGTLTTLRTAA